MQWLHTSDNCVQTNTDSYDVPNVSYARVIYSHMMRLWYLQSSSSSQVVAAVAGMHALVWEVLVKVFGREGEVAPGSAPVVWVAAAPVLADCVLLSCQQVYHCRHRDTQHSVGFVFCRLYVIWHHGSPVSCPYVVSRK